MPSSFATRPRPRLGFTLIELSVVLVVMSLLFAVILPAMQQVRHRESEARAALRLRQIAAAMFQFHAAHGNYPDSFGPLQPFLDEDLWTALVNDQAVDGSKFRGRPAGDGAIELFEFSGIDVEHGDVSAHARRHVTRMRPGIARAEDHDAAGRGARHAAKQHARAAVGTLEKIGRHLHRKTAGNL